MSALQDTLAAVKCADHPDVGTSLACAACGRALCETCATHEIDGQPGCAACARDASERTAALGGVVVALMTVAYLAALALGVLAVRGRPVVGGFAAVAAIVVGRALQVTLKLPSVVARPSGTPPPGPSTRATA